MPQNRRYVWVCVLSWIWICTLSTASVAQPMRFLGQSIPFPTLTQLTKPIETLPYGANSEQAWVNQFEACGYRQLAPILESYRQKEKPDDWLFYQLIRKAANHFAPKEKDYASYTWLKWYLLQQTGYEAVLRANANTLLLYVQSNETVYDIPCYYVNNQQYVCLNFHDYAGLDLQKTPMQWTTEATQQQAWRGFSYAVHQLPELPSSTYENRELVFQAGQQEFRFDLRVNPTIQQLFQNYPSVDYATQFNMPLSQGTYASLIPRLKNQLRGLRIEQGLQHLLHFTRYAFLFKPDTEQFGKEKRLTPEQTLLYAESDCEDRAALFYYLVKEIYQRPMLVVGFPQHVTIAVDLGKNRGDVINYNGQAYTICEPSPQQRDLKVGEMLPSLRNQPYEILLTYNPSAPLR